jgi:DNA polymerase I-like protein with 3'-5' exonuclease and polymerase domains
VQSAAADIMRVAAILMFEAGIAINAIIHDAFLIEADAADIEEVAGKARRIMMQAAELVIGGSIPVSCEITGPSEQFYDEDGEADFRTLMGMLEEVERGPKAA